MGCVVETVKKLFKNKFVIPQRKILDMPQSVRVHGSANVVLSLCLKILLY